MVWPQNRGVAIKDGRLVRGTTDGYLIALNARTGALLWERAAADPTKGETFTMAPLVFRGSGDHRTRGRRERRPRLGRRVPAVEW